MRLHDAGAILVLVREPQVPQPMALLYTCRDTETVIVGMRTPKFERKCILGPYDHSRRNLSYNQRESAAKPYLRERYPMEKPNIDSRSSKTSCLGLQISDTFDTICTYLRVTREVLRPSRPSPSTGNTTRRPQTRSYSCCRQTPGRRLNKEHGG